jgi:hypothetical protein
MPIHFPHGWPYAAKAIVQHEFDTDHLNIYLTFSQQMNVATKPDNSLWLVKLEGILTAITSSEWLDVFTLKLVINDVEEIPDRVTVAYDGPVKELNISDESGIYIDGIKYGKQWEPFGPIPSSLFG